MIGTDVSHAAQLLSSGQLIGFPTETVYGLAANALDENAVASIYELKGRPSFNPLIIHVDSKENAQEYCVEFSRDEQELISKFWPGPLTIIKKKRNNIPSIVTAGLDTVAIRIPKHPLALELLSSLNFPLAAPSANPSNQISPTEAQHVADAFDASDLYTLDGGRCTEGIESTIIRIQDNQIHVLREGSISREELKNASKLQVVANNGKSIKSPGQLAKHYSPNKPLLLLDDINSLPKKLENKKVSALLHTETSSSFFKTYYLSKSSDYKEIAKNLFSLLHSADADDSDVIVATRVENIGIGRAINDKLKRAAYSAV